MRILIDGSKAYDDPRCRNAVQREGVRALLAAGPHEITAVLGGDYFEIGFYLAVLDPDRRPHTPVTIPNTVVKPSCADGTALVRGWESRTLPQFSIRSIPLTSSCP